MHSHTAPFSLLPSVTLGRVPAGDRGALADAWWRFGDGRLGQVGVLIQETLRVLRNALEAHFEMQVRSGRAAGVPAQADQLATLDNLPLPDFDL